MRKTRDQIYDELLVLKCRQGDREAFEELVARWQERLWVYAYEVTRSEAVAWDIVQETWIGIITGIRKLQDVAAWRRWAFRILNNKAADQLRRHQLQARLGDQLLTQARQKPQNGNSDDEEYKLLQQAMARLSPEQRGLLTLRYSEDFDLAQIAEILGIPEGTVKSRLHRTLEKLRQIVKQI